MAKYDLDTIRHSTAHLMAQAITELFPNETVQLGIGPTIENGFYYDIEMTTKITDDHLVQIEEKMRDIIKRALPITRHEVTRPEAIEYFKGMKQDLKCELIRDLPEGVAITYYKQGDDFADLCRGPHVMNTGHLPIHFKLLHTAGAYWRGDQTRPMLQRIYAACFSSKEELKEYLTQIEEAKKRDHRKLGKELGMFTFHPWAPGSPFFTGRGAIVYNELQKYLRELYFKYGYNEVITPQFFDTELFKTSGHLANYKDNMFFTKVDERDFGAKPMNCPSHCLLFDSEKYSYRDLPYRMADFGRLHRNEISGALSGLTRVRTFCQDDGHIFCTKDQLQSEIKGFVTMLNEIYQKLGMSEYKVFLSTRPENRMGTEEDWDKAEGALELALKSLNIPFEVNPGDGAFYGPKLDIMFVDALKRSWQLGTVQCDPNLPLNFGLKYTGEDNAEHTPLILHRAVLGSLERFIGVYLEHTAGHLPTWLSPTQVCILNVTDRVNEFCDKVQAHLKENMIRVEFDKRNEKLNFKIREAQLRKIPFMLIVGDKEAEAGTVSIRLRDGTLHNNIKWEDACTLIINNSQNRELNIMIPQSAVTSGAT